MKFHLGVSKAGYQSKPIKPTGITYVKTELNPQKLFDLILSGHVFTHNFKDLTTYYQHQKTTETFESTNVIFFDFDNCQYTFQEVLNKLKVQPTIGYTTFSNSIDKNRFRLVYLIDEGIRFYDDYSFMCKLLLNILFESNVLNEIQESIDTRCFSATQFIYGSGINCERVFNPDQVISVDYLNDLLNQRYSTYKEFEREWLLNAFEKNQTKSNKKKESKSKEKCLIFSNSKEYNNINTILQNGKNQTPNVFAAKGILKQPSFKPIISNTWTAQLNPQSVYSYVGDQGVYQLNTFFGKNGKIKQGKRHSALFRYCAIIRNIYPGVSMEIALANLMWFRKYYIESPDEVSDIELSGIVEGIFKSDSDLSSIGKRKYLIAPEYKGLSKEEKRKEVGKAKKKYRDELILSSYDFNLSVLENSKFLGISKSSIYQCIKDNGLVVRKEEEFVRFKDTYLSLNNKDRTIRKMMKYGFSKFKCEKYIMLVRSN